MDYLIVWLTDDGKEVLYYSAGVDSMVDAIEQGERRLGDMGVKLVKLVRGYKMPMAETPTCVKLDTEVMN